MADNLEEAIASAEDPTPQTEKAKRINPFSIFIDIELVILAVLVLALAVPKLFGIVPDVVLSASMQQTCPEGSIVYLDSNIAPADLAVGDVAAYQATDKISVMHRIVDISDSGAYTFKGDSNDMPDNAYPTFSNIIGTYMAHIPYVGYAYIWVVDHLPAVIAMIAIANISVFAISKLYTGRTSAGDR